MIRASNVQEIQRTIQPRKQGEEEVQTFSTHPAGEGVPDAVICQRFITGKL